MSENGCDFHSQIERSIDWDKFQCSIAYQTVNVLHIPQALGFNSCPGDLFQSPPALHHKTVALFCQHTSQLLTKQSSLIIQCCMISAIDTAAKYITNTRQVMTVCCVVTCTVKFALEHAMKAQSGSRGIGLFLL